MLPKIILGLLFAGWDIFPKYMKFSDVVRFIPIYLSQNVAEKGIYYRKQIPERLLL